MRPRFAGLACAALLLAGCHYTPPAVASAWGSGATLPLPPRPPLRGNADARSPISYIVRGDGMLAREHADSAAAAYWASRLDPAQPSPYYAPARLPRGRRFPARGRASRPARPVHPA